MTDNSKLLADALGIVAALVDRLKPDYGFSLHCRDVLKRGRSSVKPLKPAWITAKAITEAFPPTAYEHEKELYARLKESTEYAERLRALLDRAVNSLSAVMGPTHPNVVESRAALAANPREEYARQNPLGGPASMFRVMAERIEAGEPYQAVLDDYGVTVGAALASNPAVGAEAEKSEGGATPKDANSAAQAPAASAEVPGSGPAGSHGGSATDRADSSDFKCCGRMAAEAPCRNFRESCQNPANYDPPLPPGTTARCVAVGIEGAKAGWVYVLHPDGVNWTSGAKLTDMTFRMLRRCLNGEFDE